MDIQWIGANKNNYEVGRREKTVKQIVLHWIVGKLAAADATFQDANRQASAHYGVGNKVIHQYVKEEDTAYHAGNFDINLESIGIEHEGGPDLPISEDTYKTSIELITSLCKKYTIPADRNHIRIHKEFKATQCPGTLDVDRIVREVQKNLFNTPPGGSITIPVTERDYLIGRATVAKEVAINLKLEGNPDQVSLDKYTGSIEGLRSLAKALQTQLSEAQAEVKNREEQVERIKQTYEASAKTQQARIDGLETAQKAWESEREVLKAQVTQFATDKGKLVIELEQVNARLTAALNNQTDVLTLGDVVLLLWNKIKIFKLK